MTSGFDETVTVLSLFSLFCFKELATRPLHEMSAARGLKTHFQGETSLVNLYSTVRTITSCRLFVCLTVKISTYAAPTVGVGWLVMSANWCVAAGVI